MASLASPTPAGSATNAPSATATFRNPIFWVPTLYLAMGIPFNVIMSGTAARMYKSLGYGDGQITVALGSIGVAWSLKPLWAAFLDMYRTKKFFVLSMELLLTGLLIAVAMSLPTTGFFQTSIAILWVAAFASSTQDICGDGIYLTAMDRPSQARLAGWQSTFWVLGKVFASGVLISAMDWMREKQGWSNSVMWQAVMGVCALSMALLAVYHFFFLPTGSTTERPTSTKQVVQDFLGTATSFFHKRMFWGMIAFVFLYRLGEGLILMEGQLFLQSPVEQGGLGLTVGQVSNIDAVYGTTFNILGGLLGGWFVARRGLSKSLWFLGLCLNIPHFTFVALSHFAATRHGLDYSTVVTLVSIEKFGYGFGFVGNMIYMMQQLAPGRSTMTHYAFATALMNLMLVPTNMISGPLAETLGFSTFFFVVMFASIPSAWAAFKAPFPYNRENVGADGSITPDDPTRISPAEHAVQKLAGRASMFAMLGILVILVLDARCLGWLQGATPGPVQVDFKLLWLLPLNFNTGLSVGQIVLALVSLLALLKLYLALKVFGYAKRVTAESATCPGNAYRGNARGAKIAVLLTAAATLGILAFAVKMAF